MGSRRHLYHLVNASPWPFFVSTSSLFFVSGAAFYMHKVLFAGYFLIFGLLSLCYSVFFWFADIVDEGTRSGYHTKIVKRGLKLGFMLFIVSELMLFFGFFWAFFHASVSPAIQIGGVYPPPGIKFIKPLELPFFNTAVLIVSGVSVTWAHRGMAIGSFKEAMDSLLITIILGIFFIILQGYEYYESAFSFSDGVYGSVFYMLTGLHGAHVIAGVVLLIVSFLRVTQRHFLTNHYLGFVFAMWYWHFVDVVWIFLYLSVYGWGNW